MISESDAQNCVDWLRDTAEATAMARANRIYLEEYRKSLKAICMKKHLDKAVSAQEREAYSDPEYIAHLEVIKKAVHAEQKALFLKEAASAKLEVFRTLSANYRGLKI